MPLFFFWDFFLSSLLSLLWILFQEDCPSPLGFSCSCGFLPCLFVCNIFLCHLILSDFLCLWSPVCSLTIIIIAMPGFYPRWMRLVQGLMGASWWKELVHTFWGVELGIILWWAGLCHMVCFEEVVSSVWLKAACLLMGGAVFLSCSLFGLRHSSSGTYRWGEAWSWCQNGDHLESSCWSIYLRVSATSVLAPKVS